MTTFTRRAVLIAALIASCATRDALACGGPKPAEGTHVKRARHEGAIIGTVSGWNPNPSCMGRDCFRYPLLRVKAERALKGEYSGDLVFHLPLPGEPPNEPDDVRVGDVVCVLFTEDKNTTTWSCNELLPCDHRPPRILWVEEVFRPLRWKR